MKNAEILSEFNREQIKKVESFDMNTRRRILKSLRTHAKDHASIENVIFVDEGINMEHFCTGQTLFHSTSKNYKRLQGKEGEVPCQCHLPTPTPCNSPVKKNK